MQEFVQAAITWYFSILDHFGLLGVTILMAMESSIFPIPSELVVPPAAYLESHAKGGALMLTLLVIVAGTFGSYLGSSVTYWVARSVGRPFVVRYGKYFFLSEAKLQHAETWIARYGAAGVFVSRLLPGVRHINAIPAGIARMRFLTFTVVTLAGSAIWCTVLTIFGMVMAQDMETLIQSGGNTESSAYQQSVNKLTWASIILAIIVITLYAIGIRIQQKLAQQRKVQPNSE